MQLPLPEVRGADIPILYIEMDGTGVPVVAAETIGRPSKDGVESARTREVKLGCVFTQSRLDDEGRPVRDESSTSYTGAIEGAEQFGRRIWQQAWERGWYRAKKKSCSAMGRCEFGTSPTSIFPGRWRSSISTMPASICGN